MMINVCNTKHSFIKWRNKINAWTQSPSKRLWVSVRQLGMLCNGRKYLTVKDKYYKKIVARMEKRNAAKCIWRRVDIRPRFSGFPEMLSEF